MNCDFIKKLAIPAEIKEMFPVTKEMEKTVAERQRQIEAIFEGKVQLSASEHSVE